jgi:hypothetical protein
MTQVSDPVSFCKSPVVKPYFVDNAAHPEPEAIIWPSQVVVAAAELAVEVAVVPKLMDVGIGASA